MSFRVNIHGFSVVAETADEAFELVSKAAIARDRAAAKSVSAVAPGAVYDFVASTKPGEARTLVEAKPAPASRPPESIEFVTLRFLHAILGAGPMGADTDAILRAVAADHPKGIGSKTAVINRYLSDKGLKVEEVYTRTRGPLGRIWTPGPRLGDAIVGVQEIVDAHAS